MWTDAGGLSGCSFDQTLERRMWMEVGRRLSVRFANNLMAAPRADDREPDRAQSVRHRIYTRDGSSCNVVRVHLFTSANQKSRVRFIVRRGICLSVACCASSTPRFEWRASDGEI